MRNLQYVGMTSALAIAACLAVVDSANAQAVYSGGGTLASKVYRQMMDCFAIPVNTSLFPIAAGCASTSGDVSGLDAQILYSPVGSGGGKRAFRNHNPGTSTSTVGSMGGLGVPATSNSVPYTSPLLATAIGVTYPYPDLHFAGSDDVLTSTDLAAYDTNNLPALTGNPLQVPAMTVDVAIMFNGNDGNGNPLTFDAGLSVPSGGSSKLNLSRQALCGIFTGHITQWSNPILSALGVHGSGQITVVHRTDGSGTTFLTTNALVAQCNAVTGPNNESDSTTVLYNFKYTDNAVGTGTCNALPVEGSDQINWPDNGNDQCNQTIFNPTGAVYAQASGSGGVTNLVQSTNGAVGYISPDFVQPVVPTGPAAANLQSQFDIDTSSGEFWPPTPANAALSISSVTPAFNLTYPLLWSENGIVPNPNAAPATELGQPANAYAIAGFTWLDLYQCISDPGVYQVLDQYLGFFYSSSSAYNILTSNGFSPLPGVWATAADQLADPFTGLQPFLAAGNGACAGKGGA